MTAQPSSPAIGSAERERFMAYVLQGAKPRCEFRTGLELEVFGYDIETFARIDPERVERVMRHFADGAQDVVHDGASTIGVNATWGAISLEPGGQVEFSSVPLKTLGALRDDVTTFAQALARIGRDEGILFTTIGFDPLRRLDEQRWIDKRRYAIMRPYLATRGTRAWDMMTRTTSLQVSVDFENGADLVQKYAAGNRLGPIVAAMFANSPFADGRPNGLKSNRYFTWLDTDAHRSGVAPAAAAHPPTLEALIDGILDVPLIFVRRGGEMVDRAGVMLAAIGDRRLDDFIDLLSTVFTEARVRPYVEMRSADGNGPAQAIELAAFWKGLAYDDASLSAALELAPSLDLNGYRNLASAVARDALQARAEGIDVLSRAKALVKLAREGLARTAPAEAGFLDELAERVIEREVSPADILLAESGGNALRALELRRMA